MKLPCNVIEDLLPLYHDGVCSEESRTLVEEHLRSCETCKNVLENLNTEAPIAHVDDTAALQALKKQWGRSLAKSFAKGLVLACLVCSLIWGSWYGLTQYKTPVPADILQISQVSVLSTGQIVYAMDTTDERTITRTQMFFDHGPDGVAVHIVPMRSIYEKKQNEYERANNKHMFNLALWSSNPDFAATRSEIVAIYVGPEDDGILLWEKGMELPAASQEMEAYFENFSLTTTYPTATYFH